MYSKNNYKIELNKKLIKKSKIVNKNIKFSIKTYLK